MIKDYCDECKKLIGTRQHTDKFINGYYVRLVFEHRTFSDYVSPNPKVFCSEDCAIKYFTAYFKSYRKPSGYTPD